MGYNTGQNPRGCPGWGGPSIAPVWGFQCWEWGSPSALLPAGLTRACRQPGLIQPAGETPMCALGQPGASLGTSQNHRAVWGEGT